MAIGKEIYTLQRTHGGLALDYLELIESDFAAASGPPYVPPEENNLPYRRINVSRAIQLLAECPGVIETFQTSAAYLRLPANTVVEASNDAGNGRVIFLRNSGTGSIQIQSYTGTNLLVLRPSWAIKINGNSNEQWDFDFTLDLTKLPNTFRYQSLDQILNDLDEEVSGKGFSEITYTGAFVSKITAWDAPAKNKKRTETDFSYSPVPFISSLTKKFYDEDGAGVIATITMTVSYNTNKTVKDVNAVITRP